MSDYIKREDAINGLAETMLYKTNGDNEVAYMLRDIPSADVVEVVRCKDCKHCENVIVAVTNSGEKTQRNICHRFKMAVDAKHFCSYGERKEREHE